MCYPQRLFRTFMFSICLYFASGLHAQQTIFQAFMGIDSLRLQVLTDLDSLLEKPEDYLDGILRFTNATGDVEAWDIRIKTRGKFRRKTCDIPNFQIDFSKKDLRNNGYREFDKIKLVGPCFDNPEGVENLYEEMLVYQLYQVITDESFMVKPMHLTIMDINDNDNVLSHQGFMIEPTNELAARLHGKEIDRYSLPPDSLVSTNYNRVALFQFMVSNFDWDLEVQRNLKLVYRRDGGKYHLIPYDFDFSGIVFADYTIAPASLGITSKRDRVYLGKYFLAELDSTVDEFLAKEEQILETCDTSPYLDREQLRITKHHLKDFFKFLKKSPEELAYGFVLKG